MNSSAQIEGRAYALAMSNVDTDLIIPAIYLKTTHRSGLGRHAFERLRQTPVNIFDDRETKDGAPILIALDNFGCGSSREHAAWALADLGVRAIIAPSFSDIFAANAFKNGLAAIELGRSAVEELLAAAPGATFQVSLEHETVASSLGHRFEFSMDPFRRECLLNGIDEIALTLTHEAAIRAHEQRTGI